MNYHPRDTPECHSRTQCPTGAEGEPVLLPPGGHARECVVVLKYCGARFPIGQAVKLVAHRNVARAPS
jgi:hypothetical protein